jgi:hypothetical protein
MKEHIKELAEEYSKSLMYEEGEQYTTEELEEFSEQDFTAGINRVLQNPEEFGLQTKEYV